MPDPIVLLTTGYVATHIGGGVQRHHIDRMCRRGKIPFLVVGRATKLIREVDLPKVREACIEAGYLRPELADAAG